MKTEISIFILLLFFYSCSTESDNKQNNNPTNGNFQIEYSEKTQNELKVVELFTSESCSDCPDAERALYILDSTKEDVICLAEHVDYWNGLIWGDDECNGNWVDKYSTGENTIRHAAYSQRLNQIQATPQAVINGKIMLPDSKYDSLAYLVDHMKIKPCYSLKFKSATGIKDRKIDIDFECVPIEENINQYKDSLPIRHMLYVYFVENKIVSKPNKGENCGKTLYGNNIVRTQKIISLRGLKNGSITLTIPDDAVIENCNVYGVIQNLKNHEILGSSYGFSFKKI